MRKLISLCLILIFAACNSQDKRPLTGETEYQRRLNAMYKDASTSPLKKKDLKNFKGLDFFPVDSSFVVSAKLTRTPDAPFFLMPTTGDTDSYYREYGTLSFRLEEREFTLTLYESKDEMQDPRYRDYLFLPFTDDTSSDGSYGGGRYINLFKSRIQEDSTLVIDFNNSYNPYCAYNDKYSCPVVPRKNYLDVAVKAGVMDFKR